MTTFGQLKTDVDNWLARDDIAVTGASISSIMLMAESELARDFRTLIQEQRTTLTTGADRFIDLPANFLELRQIFIDNVNGTRRNLVYFTPETLRDSVYWAGGSGGSVSAGTVAAYTIEGDDAANAPASVARLVLAPEPDASNPETLNLLYVTRWPALTADPDTNWLMQNYYDTYLWQTLKQATIFSQDLELAEFYGGKYSEAKHFTGIAENRKRFRGTAKVANNSPRPII
jgi:hypothetical protein